MRQYDFVLDAGGQAPHGEAPARLQGERAAFRLSTQSGPLMAIGQP